jgi:streptomycin 6-kinase
MPVGYSKSHIDKVLKEQYHYRLEDERGNDYKAYRYNPLHTYRVIDMDRNAIIMQHITLEALANVLKEQGDY